MSHGQCLLAACGGDTVKLFDVSVETGDPCTCQYTPTPGSQVNCVKWNHTNLVVASAGEDRRISLWMKNGQALSIVPQLGIDTGDNTDESILAITFSNKGSRYLCSGGTGKVIRVWDMQRRRCIKWLKGHTDTVTGIMYNSKDEHLASISLKGDLILHNLSSGTRATQLKDPHEQVLRVLEYSRLSRHILVTAGDDGSIHIWDTTGRNPKVSWIKQHSAPATGVAFNPSSDKVVVSVGLDKKLYTYDPGMKKPVYCIPCEAPFTSLAFKDDGLVLAAGTNNGRVMFYDVRGRPQPFTILRAYGTSEAVSGLSWQRSNPIIVNESNCTAESALLGVIGEDSVLMPDPLPASTSSLHSRTAASSVPGKASTRLTLTTAEIASVSGTNMSRADSSLKSLAGEETPISSGNHQWTKSAVSRLQTPRNNFSIKDDMEVFSPLVDVQPITPSVSDFWDSKNGLRGEPHERKFTLGPTPPGEVRKFPSIEELKNESHLNTDYRPASPLEDLPVRLSHSSPFASTPPPGTSPKERSPSVTPPEAWGGDINTDNINFRQPATLPMSRFASPSTLASSSALSSKIAITTAAESLSISVSTASDNLNLGSLYSSNRSIQGTVVDSLVMDKPTRVAPVSEPSNMVNINDSSSGLLSLKKSPNSSSDTSISVSTMVALGKKFNTYGERMGHSGTLRSTSLPGDGTLGRQMKMFGERNEAVVDVEGQGELRSDATAIAGSEAAPTGHFLATSQRGTSQQEQYSQGPPPFALQLVQRTLEESLGVVQRAIHEDVQNLHLELLRQFHIQQTESTVQMDAVLVKQAEMMEEIVNLRKEVQQLRQLL